MFIASTNRVKRGKHGKEYYKPVMGKYVGKNKRKISGTVIVLKNLSDFFLEK